MTTNSHRVHVPRSPMNTDATAPAVSGRLRIPTGSLWLSGALLLVSGVAAGLTAFGNFLSGPPAMMGSARGTAVVLLLVTGPVLAVAMAMGVRGSARATVVWLGALAAVVYNAQMLLYGTPFNSLFLLYVAMLGLSVWSIAWLVLRGHVTDAVASRVDDWMPVRPIATYIWLVAGLNAVIWLRAILPAVFSAHPTTVLDGTGLTTNPVYVQDLALWLPLAIVAGIWLWRRGPAGYLICGGLLTMWVIEGMSVAVDQWFGYQADPASAVVSLSMVPAFGVLAVIGLLPLIVHLRHVAPVTRPS